MNLKAMKIDYIKYEKSHGGREKYFPVGKRKDLVGDCVIRAVALALDMDYMQVLRELMKLAVEKFGIPYANNQRVYEDYLNSKGWVKKTLKEGKSWKPLYKHKHRLEQNKNYIFYVRVGFNTHLTSVVKGVNKDTWLCQDKMAYAMYEKS